MARERFTTEIDDYSIGGEIGVKMTSAVGS